MFDEASPQGRGTEYFSYNFYTCTNPFIHLLGSSLIQWIIVRTNGREEPAPRQIRKVEFLDSGPPRHSDLRLGRDLGLGVHSYA